MQAGWAFSERGGNEIFLETASGRRYPVKTYRLPGTDVAQHHGAIGTQIRFDEFICLEESTAYIVSGRLVLVTADCSKVAVRVSS